MTNTVVCILAAGLLLYLGLCWFDPWDIDPWKRGRRKKLADPIIDPNARCPACGACEGTLSAYWTPVRRTDPDAIQSVEDLKLLVSHRCKACGYVWDELPLFRQDETESSQ